MKLKLSSATPDPAPGTDKRGSANRNERRDPALLLDFLRRWAEAVRREVDTEVALEDVLPRETAIEVPEERFAYLLTLIYRFLSRSPVLGDPRVRAEGKDGLIAILFTADKTEPRRLSEREALGVSDRYLGVVGNELAACRGNWYFDETKDRFTVVVTLAPSDADVSRLLAPIPDAITRAVKAALADADRFLLRSR